MQTYGKQTWLIPDCYLEPISNGQPSHETICVLNTSPVSAKIKLTLFFEDRDADTSFSSHCGSMRTHHIRLDKIRSSNGNLIVRAVPYADRKSVV